MSTRPNDNAKLAWDDLPFGIRDQLTGKLNSLYDAKTDREAFNGLAVDKQQALLLLSERIEATGLWDTVRKVENVYGLGGVGMGFTAWPMIRSLLRRKPDFTRLFARHKHTSGGFYERGRDQAVLHFIFQRGNPDRWFVHFDLHSPVFSLRSLRRHLRVEVLGKHTPDWREIRERLKP